MPPDEVSLQLFSQGPKNWVRSAKKVSLRYGSTLLSSPSNLFDARRRLVWASRS
jgi:hypothetical protein